MEAYCIKVRNEAEEECYQLGVKEVVERIEMVYMTGGSAGKQAREIYTIIQEYIKEWGNEVEMR